jgi:nucleoside 2-deoxyribosyltransferase
MRSKCQLCDETAEHLPEGDTHLMTCSQCGKYRLSDTLAELFRQGSYANSRWILSCVTRNATDAGNPPITLTADNVDRLIAEARIPGPVEVMNRILLDIGNEYGTTRNFSDPASIDSDKCRQYFLIDSGGLFYAMKELELQGFLRNLEEQEDEETNRTEFYATITATGWQKIAELESERPRTWQAFVAMSFNEALRPVYDDAIKPALKQLSYDPIRLDRVDHNERIDDKIIAELKRSALVVADFTGHRTGVYFEAGFAMGRGIPVIWCCRKDDMGGAHPDTRQYNHIDWTTPDELRERLIDRIRATVPYRDAFREYEAPKDMTRA